MQCVIPSQHIRILVRGLHSLSRIGDDLYVEPTENRLCFRTVNTAQSAYSSLVFDLPFFNQYKCEFDTEEGGKCKLSMKSCLAVFKTPNCMDRNVDSCKIEIDKDCMKLSFQVHFIQGYTKNFFLSVSENETVQLKYNKDEMCNKISILSKTLSSALKHFRANDDEITFTVTSETARLKNYFQNVEVSDQKVVRTSLSLKPSDFELYEIVLPGSITFALRELRAVCTFAELSNSSPLKIFFETCGKPVIFSVRNNSIYEGDYVVSTLPPEMMTGERPHRRSQLSDVVSTVPSTSAGTVNKRRKLTAVVEEPEPSVHERQALTNKSAVNRSSSTSVPRVSLVDIIKYNDDQRSTPQSKMNSPNPQPSIPYPIPEVEPRVNDVPEFPPDDINNECIEMICDQVEELTKSQADRIEKVFRYCYSYSADAPMVFDSDEILCNASNVGIE
ncbi:hypothetical protein V9T40_008717 [Parthenolecanium corni]|uniref:Cell cycle checkpoint control protein RAD9A n=1 Tax=Parthenolecanium corni TaxID=536013 RepID=A0AAN9TR14_9HEMI